MRSGSRMLQFIIGNHRPAADRDVTMEPLVWRYIQGILQRRDQMKLNMF